MRLPHRNLQAQTCRTQEKKVINLKYYLVVGLLTSSTTAFGKELPLPESAEREPDRTRKGGQIDSETIIDAAQYLRWHRNAMALRTFPDRSSAYPRSPYLQL
jgi:hypothetical protein